MFPLRCQSSSDINNLKANTVLSKSYSDINDTNSSYSIYPLFDTSIAVNPSLHFITMLSSNRLSNTCLNSSLSNIFLCDLSKTLKIYTNSCLLMHFAFRAIVFSTTLSSKFKSAQDFILSIYFSKIFLSIFLPIGEY